MKKILHKTILLTLLIFIAGCQKEEAKQKKAFSGLMNQLEQIGFFNYTDPAKKAKVKKDCIESGYVYGWEETNRDYMSDAEELTEAGLPDFIAKIKPFLEKQGVKIESVSHNYPEKFKGKTYEEQLKEIPQTYIVTVNGKEFVIWTQKEIDNTELDVWQLSTDRTINLINHFLQEAGSKERAYQVYNGNDLRIVFLTKEMADLISNSKAIEDQEKPRIKNKTLTNKD